MPLYLFSLDVVRSTNEAARRIGIAEPLIRTLVAPRDGFRQSA